MSPQYVSIHVQWLLQTSTPRILKPRGTGRKVLGSKTNLRRTDRAQQEGCQDGKRKTWKKDNHGKSLFFRCVSFQLKLEGNKNGLLNPAVHLTSFAQTMGVGN